MLPDDQERQNDEPCPDFSSRARSVVGTDERGRPHAGDGWVRAGAASLLPDLPSGMRDFVTVHPAFVPAAIARLVRLGPRPHVRAGPIRVPVECGAPR